MEYKGYVIDKVGCFASNRGYETTMKNGFKLHGTTIEVVKELIDKIETPAKPRKFRPKYKKNKKRN